jgi:AcrR family transcriptional regulator
MVSKPIRRSIGALRSPEAHASILAAASEILNESGYAGFSIDAVARRASASKPTIYRWWKGKGALIMEVYEKERETALTVPNRGSLEHQLIMRMRNLWRLWQRTPLGNALRSIIAEAQADPLALTQLREDFLPKRRAWTNTLFDRAVARGEISAQADIESATTLIYSFNWYHLLTDQLGDESVIEKYVPMIVSGMKSVASRAIVYDRKDLPALSVNKKKLRPTPRRTMQKASK